MTISRTSPITRLANTDPIMIRDAMPTLRYRDRVIGMVCRMAGVRPEVRIFA
jgi:hypothetical protein